MEPRDATDQELRYWSLRYSQPAIRANVTGPDEMPEIEPCPAVVIGKVELVSVCWELDEIDLARLAKGSKLWFTCYGGLPIHSMEVIPKEDLP